MKKILIIMGRYLPGYKDGGPVRSIKNMVDRLGKEYSFQILTADRDHGDSKPYENINCREWNQVGNAEVYYVEPGGFSRETVKELSCGMDVIYLCGCFNDYARTSLFLKRKGEISGRVIIASMGLFTPGAFHIKYWKKKTYMTVLRLLGFFKKVEWSATSQEEAADIKREAGKNAVCHIAEDLPRIAEEVKLKESSGKGGLRIIFLSRISEKKNLTYAAELLKALRGNVIFDIYGNKEDIAYWERCEAKLKELPENIQWSYRGEAPAEKVPEIFGAYDVFLFPTLAENYGHVILEALSGGCIPIISDRTPWTENKMKNTGHVIALEKETEFQTALQAYVDMSGEEMQEKRKGCLEFARHYLQEEAKQAEDAYRRMFNGEKE